MLLKKTLLVSLPLLIFTACKGDDSKNGDSPADLSTAISQNSVALENKGESTPPSVSTEVPNTGSTTTNDNVTVTGSPTKGGSTGTPEQNVGQNPGQNPGQNSGGTTTKPECETFVIDFEKALDGNALHLGDSMNSQYAAKGIGFIAHRNLSNGTTVNDVKPVLIDTPKTGLGAATDLTDRQRGGYVKLTFAKPTSIISLDTINFTTNKSNLELFTMNSRNEYVSKSVQAIPQKAANETFNLSVDDHSYIRKMTIKFDGANAVDNIKVCIKN